MAVSSMLETAGKKVWQLLPDFLLGGSLVIPGVNIGGWGGVVLRFVMGNVFQVKPSWKLNGWHALFFGGAGLLGIASLMFTPFVFYFVVLAIIGSTPIIGQPAVGAADWLMEHFTNVFMWIAGTLF